jgi:hypothetical protein
MTCLVVGTGLVGCYLGAAAGATTAVAGPSGTLAATKIALPVGLRRWQPDVLPFARAVAGVGPILVACRSHQTPWSGLPRRARLAQNGLGQPRPPVVCFFALDRRADGVIVAVGVRPRVVMESAGPAWSPVVAAWRAAGIAVDEVADVRPAQWEKAILNATVGPLCLALSGAAATGDGPGNDGDPALDRLEKSAENNRKIADSTASGAVMAAVWGDARLRALCLAATAEGERIAAAAGIAIAPGLVARAERFFAAVGAHRPSVLRGPGELPWILGQILATGRRHGVTMPALTQIAARVAAVAGDCAAQPPVMGAALRAEHAGALALDPATT